MRDFEEKKEPNQGKKKSKECEPKKIWNEYKNGIEFKNSIGTRGLYEQAKMNERFYVGDQWHGAHCGNDRPLLRHNIIKRIGDYKISMISASPISVNYTAEGIPNTVGISKAVEQVRDEMSQGGEFGGFEEPAAGEEEINLVMSALSDYFRVTGERLKFDEQKEQVLRNAYISSTGILHTYWDESIKTGLYADEMRTTPIKGDIMSEVLDIENVYFGDPGIEDLQKQPYIIIAQRKSIKELKAEAKKYGASDYELEQIKADSNTSYESGDYGEKEQDGIKKAIVITKYFKDKNENGDITVKAVRVCENVCIRPEWDLGLRLYPIAKFTWERRRNNAYGESEITYLIPNQIAINRMLTASVWAVIMLGMPIMVVDDTVITDEVTNEPGQVIRATGDAAAVKNAIQYVVPPNFSPNFDNNITSLISQTLTQSGANDAALGDVNPENTSAIIAVREAATMPLQTQQNRYYQFCEDVARIWAEFWMTKYGKRSIKMVDGANVWYLTFDGERYKDLLVSAKVDVGASTLYSEAQTIRTLDNLFDRQVINVMQYLERLPKGTVPDVTALVKEMQKANEQAQAMQEQAMGQQALIEGEAIAGLSPEERAMFESLPAEQQQAMLKQAMGGGAQ